MACCWSCIYQEIHQYGSGVLWGSLSFEPYSFFYVFGAIQLGGLLMFLLPIWFFQGWCKMKYRIRKDSLSCPPVVCRGLPYSWRWSDVLSSPSARGLTARLFAGSLVADGMFSYTGWLLNCLFISGRSKLCFFDTGKELRSTYKELALICSIILSTDFTVHLRINKIWWSVMVPANCSFWGCWNFHFMIWQGG